MSEKYDIFIMSSTQLNSMSDDDNIRVSQQDAHYVVVLLQLTRLIMELSWPSLQRQTPKKLNQF